MKQRQQSRYDVKNAVQVYVGEQKYYVFLEDELVVQDVMSKGGKMITRRVTSKKIETAAILRASDKVNAE